MPDPFRTLSEELAELERTNPDVAAAASNLDRAAWRLQRRRGTQARQAIERQIQNWIHAEHIRLEQLCQDAYFATDFSMRHRLRIIYQDGIDAMTIPPTVACLTALGVRWEYEHGGP